MPVMSLHESPLTGWNVAAKRLLDIIVSLLALIPATPVMLFFGLLHKALSRGPVFYRQTRVGLDGAPFRILKLRTMRVGADHEASASWTTPDDPRVTHLGRFMRRWNIDELPQLWNVLLGHMSLVGPRPERPELIEQFRQRVPRYMLRHKMKAGMTGWAQVNGWRGNTSLDKRIQYDLYYIENWSLLFDLWVLLLTPFARKNAY
jgi:exopolysaccharide biosynthesis polyprenyl glycosylphosphotransferase